MNELINISFGGSLDNKTKAIAEVYCNNKENCKSYKEGKCVCGNGLLYYTIFSAIKCPNANIYKKEAHTKPQIRKMIEQENELRKTSSTLINVIKQDKRGVIDTGNYVLLNISYMGDGFVKEDKVLSKIVLKNAIKKEDWTKENVLRILDFRPLNIFNKVIDNYELEELPKFVRGLKEVDKAMFDEVCKERDLSKYLQNKYLIGKKAYLKTLGKGKVNLSVLKNIEWDGENLKGMGKDFSIWGLKNEEVIIKPNDDTIVEVIDEKTIKDDTKWVE